MAKSEYICECMHVHANNVMHVCLYVEFEPPHDQYQVKPPCGAHSNTFTG